MSTNRHHRQLVKDRRAAQSQQRSQARQSHNRFILLLCLGIAAALLLLATGPVKAGGFNGYRGHVGNGYHNNFEKVQFIAVEEDPYSVEIVGENLRAQYRAEAAAKSAREAESSLAGVVSSLRQEVEQLRSSLSGNTARPMPTPATSTPVQPPAPMQPETNTQTTSNDNSDLAGAAWQLLQDRCADCHNTTKKGGGFALFVGTKPADGTEWERLPTNAGKLILIDHLTYANEMPKPPHKKLDSKEYNLLRAWIQESSEEIREVARAADK